MELSFEKIVDGIVYRLARRGEDAEQVANFYWTHFLKDEPMTVSMGGYGSFPKVLHDEVVEAVNEGVTLMALEEKSGRLLGIRLSGILKRSDCKAETPDLAKYMSKYPRIHGYTMYLFHSVQAPADIFAQRSDVHKMYYMMALTTHADARGRGIASRLVNFSFEVAKLAGCDSAFVYATHCHSQPIFDKMGMTRSAQKSFRDVIIEGHKPFEKCATQDMAVYFIKF